MADEKRHNKTKATQGEFFADTQTVGCCWNIGSLFWGLLLVAFGGLLLLGNLGVIQISWGELWRLWPLFIIAAGFSVLATTHWVWKVISVVFVIIAVLAVLWVGTGAYEPEAEKSSGSQNVAIGIEQGVTNADVSVKAGASTLTVASKDSDKVVQANLESGLRLDQKSSRDGETQKVVLSGKSHGAMWGGPFKNDWDITVTERLPLKLAIDAGASRIDADLSRARLTDLTVKAGASSSVLTLGDRSVEARVTIDSGASSMTVRLPKQSGVSIQFDGGLSAREFGDLKEVSKDEYRSENYDTALNRILINANAGLASFKIERY